MAVTAQSPWRNAIVRYGEEAPEQLLAHPRNPKVHPRAQQLALEGAISELGWLAPVTVNERTQHVLDGHARISLAISRQEARVPVAYVDLPEELEALALATFDPIGNLAGTDKDALDSLLQEISTGDTALQEFLGGLAQENGLAFGDGGLPLGEAPEPEIDRAEELREKWQTADGQLWVIGRHRLLCGDSTSRGGVARLMAGERAAFGFADPPYNVGIKYGAQVDDRKPGGAYRVFCGAWWELFGHAVDGPLAVTTGCVNLPLWYDLAPPDWIIAWVKMNGVSHTKFGGPNKWEPVLVWRAPVDRDSDLIQANNRYTHELADGGCHPVSKPVELLAALIGRFCPSGHTTIDPFLGGGTTLVAAEQTGRTCYGVEIEPKYVAVTLERLSQMGLSPRLESGA